LTGPLKCGGGVPPPVWSSEHHKAETRISRVSVRLPRNSEDLALRLAHTHR